MRIIAGEKRSRVLCAPAGNETRPTADKVKEALFSILGARVPGARVLDLYAGSGALSLEALSRGAESACLVDRDRKAAEAIRKNITALDYAGKARFLPWSDREAVARLKKENARFDLVFLDPPYRMEIGPICAMLADAGLLEEGASVVAEHLKEKKPCADGRFEVTDERRYGITGLTLFRFRAEGTEQAEQYETGRENDE